jgi:hypothetical protein
VGVKGREFSEFSEFSSLSTYESPDENERKTGAENHHIVATHFNSAELKQARATWGKKAVSS